MARWFRLYDEMLDDPKVQMLSPELFKTWVNLLAVASRVGGVLPPTDKLAFALRVSAHEMQSRLEDLVLAGLIDVRADKALEPHNWPQRQWKSDDSAERVRRHRAKKCNGDVTVTVTPPEAETETEADTLPLTPSRGEQAKGFENDFLGKGSRALSARLKKRAEGLGLDVAELERRATAPDVKIPNAFFRKIVVDAVRANCPRAGPDLIKAALKNGNDAAYGTLCQMILETTP